jgi:hypothetical protein
LEEKKSPNSILGHIYSLPNNNKNTWEINHY